MALFPQAWFGLIFWIFMTSLLATTDHTNGFVFKLDPRGHSRNCQRSEAFWKTNYNCILHASDSRSCSHCRVKSKRIRGYAVCNLKQTCLDVLPTYVHVLELQHTSPVVIRASHFANFSYQKKITAFIFRNNWIRSVEKGALQNLKNVKCVNLDYCKSSLPFSAMKEVLSLPNVLTFSAKNCFLHHPQDMIGRFSNLLPQKLHSIWFSFNFMGGVCNLTSFHLLSPLEDLDLSFGGIQLLPIPNNFEIKIKRLILSHNAIEQFPQTCNSVNESTYPLLEVLDLSANQIGFIDSMFPSNRTSICLPELKYLNISRNFIRIVDVGMPMLKQLPSLVQLYLVFEATFFKVLSSAKEDTVTKSTGSKLEELYLQNNDLVFNLEDAVSRRGYNFTALHLRWQVPKAFLRNFPVLKKLSLNENNFQTVDDVAFFEYFGSAQSLKYLSLAKCRLSIVSARGLSGLGNLTTLLLKDNDITKIPNGCFDSLHKLERIDLSDNKITVISDQTFSRRLQIQMRGLILERNPFLCSCEMLWFVQWFKTRPSLFKIKSRFYRQHADSLYFRCDNIPGQNLVNFSMPDQACMLSEQTSTMIIFINTVLITSFTAMTLLFRYRWHLRLLLYEAFRGHGDVRRQYLESGTFDYDVFVSYASEDLPWVREDLMPELEQCLGLRLCIHERDFIPGKNIVDNIVDCVEKSKKIVVLFSRHFVKSQWCQFELTYCLSHVLDHEDALIVACLDDVVSREMTSAMMAVLKTTTYIQWEEESDAVRAFWGRLTLALREILPHNEHPL